SSSSATENWEIIAQSVVERSSFHIYSGAFGKKWYGFAQHIQPATGALQLDKDEELDVEALEIGDDHDLIGITQNETSNATQVSNELIRSEEHTSELQSRENLVCRLLLEKK